MCSRTQDRGYLDPCRLVHGRKLLNLDGLWDSQYPVFRVEAVFEEKAIEGEKWGGGLTVPETLVDCLAGVELVIAPLQREVPS